MTKAELAHGIICIERGPQYAGPKAVKKLERMRTKAQLQAEYDRYIACQEPAKPAPTRLMAEAVTAEAQEKACIEAGEDWMYCVEYTHKAFPDTDDGLAAALKWIKDTDVNEDGRVDRQELDPQWEILKKRCWYRDTPERYDIYELRWFAEV